jgi:hypothetical protein
MQKMAMRALSPLEKWFLRSSMAVELATEMVNPRAATEFTDFLIHTVPGFRLKTDGTNLIEHNKPVEVVKIGPGAFSSVHDACVWGEREFRPQYSDRLAIVGMRDSSVVLSIAHAIYDGVSNIRVCERFLEGSWTPAPKFPVAADTEILKAYPRNVISSTTPMATIPWSSPLVSDDDNLRGERLLIDLPPFALTCYNPKTQRFNGLSDALWSAGALVCHALNPGQRGYGSSLWVNVRPYITSYDIGNLIVPLNLYPDVPSTDMTVGDLERCFREDFRKRMQQKTWVQDMVEMINAPPSTGPGASFDISNQGPYPTAGRFAAISAETRQEARFFNGALVISVITNVSQPLSLRFAYSPHVITRSLAKRILQGFTHCLVSARRTDSVRETLQRLRSLLG